MITCNGEGRVHLFRFIEEIIFVRFGSILVFWKTQFSTEMAGGGGGLKPLTLLRDNNIEILLLVSGGGWLVIIRRKCVVCCGEPSHSTHLTNTHTPGRPDI